MITDTEIKIKGFNALVNELGDVMAEKFIALIIKEPFDYTEWQSQLLIDSDINSFSKKAMEYRENTNIKLQLSN